MDQELSPGMLVVEQNERELQLIAICRQNTVGALITKQSHCSVMSFK